MDESRRRQKINRQVSALERMLSKDIRLIRDRFCDTVTYNGRPYEQKMRWDRIEMLYWLQQERRVKALDKLLGTEKCTNPRLSPLEQVHPTTHEHTPLPNNEQMCPPESSDPTPMLISGTVFGTAVDKKNAYL